MRPDALLARAGLPTGRAARLSGGDMGEVWRVGDRVVKSHPRPPRGLFPAEARGLRRLREAGVRVPRVDYVAEEGLVMEHLASGPEDWTGLAAQVARLHATPGERYGSEEPVFLGRFPLPVAEGTDWGAFFAAQRVLPLADACAGTLGTLRPRIDRLLGRYVPPTERPVLLHGDLWSGNVHMSEEGATLIDPSAWYGERAVDLAMMRLFGGFPQPFWDAYQSERPIPAEVEEGLPFHQLYFLLVHVHFFGAGYCGGVDRVLRRYGA